MMAQADSSRVVKKTWRRWAGPVLIVATMVLASPWAISWLAYHYSHSTTEDAFVESHLINLAPQVEGHLVEVLVQENSVVRRGQLLARIDPTPYARAVAVAQARTQTARRSLEEAQAELTLVTARVPREIAVAQQKLAVATEDRSKAQAALEMIRRDVEQGVMAAQSAVEGAQANFVMAEEDFERYLLLSQQRSVAERRFEEASKTFKVTQADMRIAQARLAQAEAARQQIAIAEQNLRSTSHDVLRAEEELQLARLGELEIQTLNRKVAVRTEQVAESEAELLLAQTNLDYTAIQAPVDGVIAKKWRHLGDFAAPGSPLFSMYDPQLLYVTAKMEETRLEGIAPGNKVDLYVDAIPGPFRGRVVWLGTATAGNFSLIPRDVSSGEFTKVVQRLPIRILFDPDPRLGQLRPGLSVTVSIAHGDGDPAWAEQAARDLARTAGIKEMEP